MQAPAADPARPIDPTQPPSPASSAAPGGAGIPELGVAGSRPSDGTLHKPVTPEERSTEFVAVQGGGNTTSAEALLVSAYIVMWALLLLFVYFTWRRQQKMEARVVDLERALSQAEKEEARGTPALRES